MPSATHAGKGNADVKTRASRTPDDSSIRIDYWQKCEMCSRDTIGWGRVSVPNFRKPRDEARPGVVCGKTCQEAFDKKYAYDAQHLKKEVQMEQSVELERAAVAA